MNATHSGLAAHQRESLVAFHPATRTRRGEVLDTLRTAIDALVSEQLAAEANLTNLRFHLERADRINTVPNVQGHLGCAGNHLKHVIGAVIDINTLADTLRANFIALEKLLKEEDRPPAPQPPRPCSRCNVPDVELVDIDGDRLCPTCVHDLASTLKLAA